MSDGLCMETVNYECLYGIREYNFDLHHSTITIHINMFVGHISYPGIYLFMYIYNQFCNNDNEHVYIQERCVQTYYND
jgi:hypothetical protein